MVTVLSEQFFLRPVIIPLQRKALDIQKNLFTTL